MSKNLSPAKRIELARRLWGWEPHPTQREWLLDDHAVKVAACGRRWGKTEAAAVDIATYAIANNGTVQMICAPTYDQSRLISNHVEQLLLSHEEIRKHTRITKTPYPDIRYRDSRIMARTADEDGRNLRGHSADRVVVDEAAFVRDKVIDEVIGPMLADRDGQLVMISTPFGKNHFYRAFVQGQNIHKDIQDEQDSEEEINNPVNPVHPCSVNSRVRYFRFPSWANPHISREYIEFQRTVIAERQFKAEYEAQFVDDQSSVFPWNDIQMAINHGVTEDTETSEIRDRATRVAGIDWARYSDYTAIVIIEVSEGEIPHSTLCTPHYKVVALDRFNRMDWHSQVRRAADLLREHRVQAVAADQTSVGDPVLEMLREAAWNDQRLSTEIEGVVFTHQSKRELVDNLAIRLANRELSFPPMEQLVKELQFYEYELTESGNVKTAARSGYHDDCVMALALGLKLAPRYRFTGGWATTGRIIDSVKGW